MKYLLSLIFVMYMTFIQAQTTTEKEVQQTIENMFRDIFTQLDKTKIDHYFLPEIQIYENGEINDWEDIQEFVVNQKAMFQSEENKNNQFDRINQFEFLKTKIDGNQALIGFYNLASFTMNGTEIAKMKWLESAILKKVDNQWKIEFLHSTQVKID